MINDIVKSARGPVLRSRLRPPASRTALVLTVALLCACGKRGAPLAPLNLMPEPPSSVTGKRVSATVYVQMIAPKRNANGPGVVSLDHLEIYAVTLRPGLMIPANRDLLTPQYLVGQISIKPPPDEDESSQETDKDTRPGPGEPVTFSEQLTEKQLETSAGLKPMPPAPPTPPAAKAAPGAPSATTAGAAAAAPTNTAAAPTATTTTTTTTAPTAVPPPAATPPAVAAPAEPTPETAAQPPTSDPAGPVGPPGAAALPSLPAGAPAPTTIAQVAPPATVTGPVRIYVVRGVTGKGRPGPPSTRVTIPLVPPPPPPATPSASFTERAVSLTWTAPVAEPQGPAMTFNVYSTPPPAAKPAEATPSAQGSPNPLNTTPLGATTFEHAGAAPGVEQCFAVRTVERVSDVSLESEPSPTVCVTPKDIFPPAAPKGLAVVAMDGGVMNLIWDANTEADLAGYLVLRGEAPGDTLQPLTPQPIHETSFRDTTAKPGVRYSYAIVAVDRATPPNRSEPSAKVEESAR